MAHNHADLAHLHVWPVGVAHAHRPAHGGRKPARAGAFAETPLRYLVFTRRCSHYFYRQQLCKNTLAISLLYNDMVLDHPRAR